jgi:large subunit ribosomal protein L29
LKRLKTDELSGLSDQDLVRRLNDLRSELSTLRSKAARGTLKKELGGIKTYRRNIARVLTAINSRKISVQTETKVKTKTESPSTES